MLKPSARRWMFHGILSDTPPAEAEEGGAADYYSEEELKRIFQILPVPGLKITSLRLQELPERSKKTVKNPLKDSFST